MAPAFEIYVAVCVRQNVARMCRNTQQVRWDINTGAELLNNATPSQPSCVYISHIKETHCMFDSLPTGESIQSRIIHG